MDGEIGLSGQNREAVGQILNALLADQHVLYVKTRKYHWNVVGPQFKSLHELFEKEYKEIAAEIDETAERARSLGVRAHGTMAEFTKHARLEEDSGFPDAMTMVANLVRDHEAAIKQLRTDIDRCQDDYHDAGTADFLTALMEKHEKTAWMLRAYTQKEP
ncbi:MAG TPA: DNA starvation/stationary phase protection protein [Geminicoccaceae bacterium]|nr:DNA starvation/stationary phase protection protein [Geminicoccaceae bacterium]